MLALAAALLAVARLVAAAAGGARALVAGALAPGVADRSPRSPSALAAGGIAVVATSERGLRGSIEHAADEFTEVQRDPIYDPDRLLTTGSGNRWSWWSEAVGAWSDEPVLGWGAGSFAVTRRLYRVAPADVQQAAQRAAPVAERPGRRRRSCSASARSALLFAAAARRLRRARRPARARPRRRAARRVLRRGRCTRSSTGTGTSRASPCRCCSSSACSARAARPRRPAAEVLFEEPRAGARRWRCSAPGCSRARSLVSALLPAWSDHEGRRRARGRRRPRRRRGSRTPPPTPSSPPTSTRSPSARCSPPPRSPRARGRLLDARAHLLDAVERQPYSVEAWRG